MTHTVHFIDMLVLPYTMLLLLYGLHTSVNVVSKLPSSGWLLVSADLGQCQDVLMTWLRRNLVLGIGQLITQE
jgi:hypothetical protein